MSHTVECHAGPCRHILALCSIPLPSSGLIEPEPPNGRCFNPVLSGQEQKSEGDLHAEVGTNPKLNPRSCAKKEEKEKFLPAVSGAGLNLHNQLDVP